MQAKKYHINLSSEERNTLTKIIKTGKSPARSILRANILLQSDVAGQRKPMTVVTLAELLRTTTTTVQNVRRDYVEQGLDATLNLERVIVEAGNALEAGEVILPVRLYDMDELRRFSRGADRMLKEMRVNYKGK